MSSSRSSEIVPWCSITSWNSFLNFVPIYYSREDENMIAQFKNIFPDTKITTIVSNDIIKEGGVLNCITWNIYK